MCKGRLGASKSCFSDLVTPAQKLQGHVGEGSLAVISTPQNLFLPQSRHSVKQAVGLPLIYVWSSFLYLQNSPLCYWANEGLETPSTIELVSELASLEPKCLDMFKQHFIFFVKYYFQNSSDFSPLKCIAPRSNQTATTLNLLCNNKSTHYMIFRFIWQL